MPSVPVGNQNLGTEGRTWGLLERRDLGRQIADGYQTGRLAERCVAC
jgi:hypothetical protein